MIRYIFGFLMLTSFSLELRGEENSSYFSPKLYQNFWPNFCLEHLKQFPNECSEQNFGKDYIFYVIFLKEGNSQVYIDKEIISQLAIYSDFLPVCSQTCDFRFCQKCQKPVVRKEKYKEIWYRCHCLYEWIKLDDYKSLVVSDKDFDKPAYIIKKDWKYCSNQAVPHTYFNINSKQYIHFLEQHLKYIQNNPECLCYWPYRSKIACEISDLCYEKMRLLIKSSFLRHLKDQEYNAQDFTYLKNRTLHGVQAGLFIHCFFYSQYRQVLLKLAQWEEAHEPDIKQASTTVDTIYGLLDELKSSFLELYSACLKKHPHPKIYYERGMVFFHEGMVLESLNDIRSLIDWAEKNHQDDLLTSELYFQEGVAHSELSLYDKAIGSLTKAIEKDPNNRQAYFERASAYFELGNFDLSLEDYLASGLKSRPIPSQSIQMLSFSMGLTKGIAKGGIQAGMEFIPSMLSSLRGLSYGLWAFAQDPVQVSFDFVQASQDCINFIREHSAKETLATLVPELKELVEKWDQFEDEKKGEITGYIIGKYGIDIFAGVGVAKGMKLYRELKKANHLLTFETMAMSKRNQAIIRLKAVEQAKVRKTTLQNANFKIEWDKLGKHLEGHKNYEPHRKRSIFEHPDPERLVKTHAGTGIRKGNKIPGTDGYQEVVNFGEFIGYNINRETGEKVATTWGKIHYSKNGIHIVPTKPRG